MCIDTHTDTYGGDGGHYAFSRRVGSVLYIYIYYGRLVFFLAALWPNVSARDSDSTVFLTSAHENWLVLLVGASTNNFLWENVIFFCFLFFLFSIFSFSFLSRWAFKHVRVYGTGRGRSKLLLFISSFFIRSFALLPLLLEETRNADRNRSNVPGLIYPERVVGGWYHPLYLKRNQLDHIGTSRISKIIGRKRGGMKKKKKKNKPW